MSFYIVNTEMHGTWIECHSPDVKNINYTEAVNWSYLCVYVFYNTAGTLYGPIKTFGISLNINSTTKKHLPKQSTN